MSAQNSHRDWKPYNDQPLTTDATLIPMIVTQEAACDFGANPANLRTWTMAGVRYLVMFVVAMPHEVKISWEAFYSTLNQLLDEKLGRNRSARCLLPQPDGTVKRCPKTNGPCSKCPMRGMYEKEDRSNCSYEYLVENGIELGTSPSAEDMFFSSAKWDDLIDFVDGHSPIYGSVIRMMKAGYDRSEIVKMLPFKKTRAYEVINKTQKLAAEFLHE